MARKPKDCRWFDLCMNACRNTETHPAIWEHNGMTIFAEPECQRCEGCGYEPITPDSPAWDDPAESEKRWADEYFVKWKAAEAENARLRDLVRRLADTLQSIIDAAEGRGVGRLDEGLVREAREALEEEQ